MSTDGLTQWGGCGLSLFKLEIYHIQMGFWTQTEFLLFETELLGSSDDMECLEDLSLLPITFHGASWLFSHSYMIGLAKFFHFGPRNPGGKSKSWP